MSTDETILAGVELSPGRKPVTFAALDNELNVTSIEMWTLPEALTCLNGYEQIWLALSMPSGESDTLNDFKKQLIQVGFTSYAHKNSSRQLLETRAQDCFQALIGKKPFARRTLEGRLQRTAVLYEQGLQINDPIDLFEEITRFKLVQGILPLENIYSSKVLDALMAAYLAWLALNRPGQIVLKGDFVLPA